MKNILFYFGHPAQFHFARNTIFDLIENDCKVTLVTRSKDVLTNLLTAYNLPYLNILPEGRSDSQFGIILALLKRIFRLGRILREVKPELIVGTDAALAILGRLFSIPVITTLEDDYSVIKELAMLTYPMTNVILVPEVCDVGKWSHKKIGYNGFMKLAYLHKSKFTPDASKVQVETPFALIRLSGLSAYHDSNIKGVSRDLLKKIIQVFESKNINIKISSEQELPIELTKYKLSISPIDIHHYLATSIIFISDSQSMSVESALLGIPSIRISDFKGKISVLEELELNYKLTYGFKPDQKNDIIDKLIDILENVDSNNFSVFNNNFMRLQAEKINVSNFLTWFISDFPNSERMMRENPNYQYNFK